MGYNADGQLGDGTTNNHYVPEKVFSVNLSVRLTALAAGGGHSLFGSYTVLSGSVWAMGVNHSGQLGDGTTTGHDTPEVVASASPGTPVTASAGGGHHSLFIRPDGSLWGMGNNGVGELGDGTTTQRSIPEQIIPNGVVAVAAGYSYSFFVKSDGSLWAMGENTYGQLGDGTTNDSHIPELIVASNVVAVAAGYYHSLFIMSDGSLWGMGGNNIGQLGDGSFTDRLLPEELVFPSINLANATKLPSGAFQFSFNAMAGLGFTVLGSTNLSLPLSNWTVLGSFTTISAGQFKLIDTGPFPNKLLFYSVRSP
jgi:alpha-tubulin suppressor-like RCC1 family protein